MDIIDFDAKRQEREERRPSELLFSIDFLDDGFYISVPHGELDVETMRKAAREIFQTAWNFGRALGRGTEDLDDMPVALLAVYMSGRVSVMSHDDDLETVEQGLWLRRRLDRGADLMLRVPDPQETFANDDTPVEEKTVKTDKMKRYLRRATSMAVKLEPGMEDNWVAIDAFGLELSRAATEEGVKRAVPPATNSDVSYHPIVDLPGLDGQPLEFGTYLINDGDGIYWTLPAGEFERQYMDPEAADEDEDEEEDPTTSTTQGQLSTQQTSDGAPATTETTGSDTSHPLDHDGNGKPGGSKPGKQSTAAKGKRNKEKAKAD